MQSYRAALGPNGTTMVLSPDSEFFRFFQNQNPDNVTPPPEAATTPIPATPLVEEPPVDSPVLSQPATETTVTAPAETTPATPAPAEPAPAAPAQ